MNLKIWKNVGLSLRKRADILLLLCILGLPIPAYGLSLDSLSIGTGNDWYTMGLGYNQDDGFSFGSSLEATFDNNLSFQTFVRSYTDRIQSNRRYDEIQIGASYPFLFTPTTTIGIGVAGSAGVVLTGNLGLQTIQNWFHTLIGRDLVTLTYDENQFWVHPYLALKTQAAYLGSNTLTGIELGTSYAHQWELLFEANAFISYHGFLTLRLGYVEKYVEDLYPSQSIQEQRYEGLRLAYVYDGGLLQSSFFSFLDSGASYGSFSVNVLAFKQPKTYKQTDFTFTSGILYNHEGHQNRLVAFSFGSFSFEVKHTNGPMLNRWEDQNDRMNLGSWQLGYRWEFESPSAFLTPYAKVSAGLHRFNLQQDYTTTLVEEVRPSIGMEVGLSIGTTCWWVVGNTSYHPRLAVSLSYVFNADSITTVEYFKPHTGPWILMAGIVLDIDHDLT